jgi:hypothetical protein
MPNTFEALADLEGWEDAEITAFGIIKEIAALATLQEARAYDDALDDAEKAPDGDDYNALLSITMAALNALEGRADG